MKHLMSQSPKKLFQKIQKSHTGKFSFEIPLSKYTMRLNFLKLTNYDETLNLLKIIEPEMSLQTSSLLIKDNRIKELNIRDQITLTSRFDTHFENSIVLEEIYFYKKVSMNILLPTDTRLIQTIYIKFVNKYNNEVLGYAELDLCKIL